MNSMITPTVYDIGLHNGDDSEYYLKKGFRVIGIDADVLQCESCRERFRAEIDAGKMIVLNVGVGWDEGPADFYYHKTNSRLSTFVAPKPGTEAWELRSVSIRRLSSIIREYGPAHFVKIDAEGYDHIILQDLMKDSIHPRYISAESHLIDPFCALVCMGYEKFKLVKGATVSQLYADHPINTLQRGIINHMFHARSSGPFGEDIPGDWLDKKACLDKLVEHGLGWIDIHAST